MCAQNTYICLQVGKGILHNEYTAERVSVVYPYDHVAELSSPVIQSSANLVVAVMEFCTCN